MGEKVQGTLVIIGGAEDKQRDCRILREFVRLAGGEKARLVILTSATKLPEEVGREYKMIFQRLGAAGVKVLDLDSREVADREANATFFQEASGIFFTGGDQLRITSLLGGTLADRLLHEAYRRGVVIAGTSAGASAMSDTMIVEGQSSGTPKKNTVKMAPGLGLLEEVVIDQHFAQRGRIGRLLTAVAQNPDVLGIGIDEDTAVIVFSQGEMHVLGSRTVTVIDGRHISHTNVSEVEPEQVLALAGVILHILPQGYKYHLSSRRVICPGSNCIF